MFGRRKFRGIVEKLAASSRHTVVLGPTGSGKTTFSQWFLRYLHSNFIVFDYDGEYSGLGVRVKPKVPFGSWVEDLAVALRPSSGGVEITAAVYEAFRGSTSSWEEFVEKLERNISLRRFWRGSEAALSRLLPLMYAGVLTDREVVLPPRCVIDLSGLNEEKKVLCVLLMLTWLFSTTRSPRPVRTFVVVEEFKAALVGDQVTPVVVPFLCLLYTSPSPRDRG